MKLCLSGELICGRDYILAVDRMSNARVFHSQPGNFLGNRPQMTRMRRMGADLFEIDPH